MGARNEASNRSLPYCPTAATAASCPCPVCWLPLYNTRRATASAPVRIAQSHDVYNTVGLQCDCKCIDATASRGMLAEWRPQVGRRAAGCRSMFVPVGRGVRSQSHSASLPSIASSAVTNCCREPVMHRWKGQGPAKGRSGHERQWAGAGAAVRSPSRAGTVRHFPQQAAYWRATLHGQALSCGTGPGLRPPRAPPE